MTTTTLLRTLALTAALGLAVTACGSSDKADNGKNGSSSSAVTTIQSGTLTVCSDVPYPPFEDFDKSAPTGYKGFDVDVISEVAKRLDLKLAVVDSDFTALQSGLLFNTRKCDLGSSAMTITDERKKNILFSDGYYDSEQSLLVASGSPITSIDDLKGVKVGVQKGTTGETYTKEHAPDAKAIQFADDGKMYTALKAGQIDAILQDLPVNLDHQNDPKQSGKWKVVQTYKTDEQYGFGAKKDDSQLVDAVNKELAAMKSDGSYKKIYDSYFATS